MVAVGFLAFSSARFSPRKTKYADNGRFGALGSFFALQTATVSEEGRLDHDELNYSLNDHTANRFFFPSLSPEGTYAAISLAYRFLSSAAAFSYGTLSAQKPELLAAIVGEWRQTSIAESAPDLGNLGHDLLVVDAGVLGGNLRALGLHEVLKETWSSYKDQAQGTMTSPSQRVIPGMRMRPPWACWDPCRPSCLSFCMQNEL